jgi:peptidoglycan hydrolase-like protein with peptidoglycan-binding domain
MTLYRCYSGTKCEHAPFTPDGADPHDGLALPVSISASVGLGARNQSDDVKTIQMALNRFPVSMGGPSPKLKPDGIVGPLTAGAIEKFQRRQLGFTDQKIDPEKKTIERINQLLSTVWVAVPDRTMKKVYESIIPKALSCAMAADIALSAARPAFLNPPQGSGDPAMTALVNKYFLLDQNSNAANDFAMIGKLYKSMIALLSRNQSGELKTFIPAPGRFSASRILISGVVALSYPNGVNLTSVTKGKAQDGSAFEAPDNKVLIMPPFTFATLDYQITTIVHELGHFLGPPDGSADMIDDPPGGSSAPSEIAKLPVRMRPRIADNYAKFAFEAAFHKEPFIMLV